MSAIAKLFDNISSLGNDSSDMTNRQKQNTESANYMLENYIAHTSVNKAVSVATNQPNLVISGSSGGGINRNNIDIGSRLQLTSLTKEPERNVYQERLFATVPYLGKGPSNVDVEDRLVGGDLTLNRKSTDPNSEIIQTSHIYYPLIPSIEANITNPANCVEGVASADWVRGGIPSRILNRDEDRN